MQARFLDQALGALTKPRGAALAASGLLGAAFLISLLPATAVSTAIPQRAAAPTTPLVRAQAAGPAANSAQGVFTAEQRKAIESIIKEYLVQNPDVMVEVTKELEKRQTALQADEHKKVIVDQKSSLFGAPTDFVLGNPKGNIAVVEFLDYNCGWCKKAVDEMTKLTKADPNVRVIFKEFPIFGEDSIAAAKAAMASVRQNKYWDFHVALMKERRVTKDNVYKIAEKVGLDVARLKVDMADPKIEEALKETQQVAQALGIEGTPGFIVDTRVNVGFVPADGLKEMIAEVRKTGCLVC